jgi:uncharacterized protein (TIGR02147 family)
VNTSQDQIAVQKLLQREFAELRSKNPRISVRAFSKRLGLSAGALNEILKGERRVSAKMAAKIAERLLLSPSDRASLIGLFPKRVRRKHDDAERAAEREEALRLTADQFHAIAEWTHFAILSLVRTRDFRSDPAWIAERLEIRPDQAQASLQRLIRMGLLESDPENASKLRRTRTRIETSDDVRDLAIQRSHLEDLERVARSIRELPVELRDVSSFTVPADPALLPEAKVILRRAQDEIDELMKRSPGTEVYRVLTCLFPLTRVRQTAKKTLNQEKMK